MDHYTAIAHFPLELPNRFNKGKSLDITHNAADFRYYVVVAILFAQELNATLDFVRNMRDYLHGFAQIVPAPFLANNRLINTSRGYIIAPRRLHIEETFVMTQVQIRFASVIRYVAFAVFIRIKRSRIDIDIGIELLNRYFVATCLEQLAYRGGYNSLS